jgi:hypothetical protein
MVSRISAMDMSVSSQSAGREADAAAPASLPDFGGF